MKQFVQRNIPRLWSHIQSIHSHNELGELEREACGEEPQAFTELVHVGTTNEARQKTKESVPGGVELFH